MAEERKYFLRTVYRYGHVSTVEGRLLKHAQSFRNNVFSSSALDRFVQELKDLETAFLKENPKRPACRCRSPSGSPARVFRTPP